MVCLLYTSWAGQTLGCSYGGPTEFKFLGTIIQDYIPIPWDKHTVKNWYDTFPGLYDDVYVDLTFVEVFERCGLDAPVDSFATAFGRTEYPLWHANQVARYNLLQGVKAPQSGYWKNNPHAPVSYTHLDVYKRQRLMRKTRCLHFRNY